MVILYLSQIDDMIMGTYYFESAKISVQPSIPAIAKLERIVEQLRNYNKEGVYSNITVDKYCDWIIYELVATMAYVNALALSDREIVQSKTIYKDNKHENSNKSNGGKKRKKKFKKVSLIKKYTIRTDDLIKKDYVELRRTSRIISKESWNVAGHWRYYRDKQTGEVLKKIWVNEHKKGVGRLKNKTYVLD